MNVLVTGDAGFIGGYVRKALRAGDEVHGIDLKHGRSILDMPTLPFAPEVVVHLAAHHYVPWCREHPEETLETNVAGTHKLLSALERSPRLRTVILASSAAVYGFGGAPFVETSDLNPVDVYGESKVLAEALLRGFADRHQVACVVARLSNVIGAGDRHPHLFPRLAEGGPVELGNDWPLRDYIYAGDVADALVRLMGAPWGYHVYNVGTGFGMTPREVVGEFSSVRGYPAPVTWGEGRDQDGHLVLDVAKISRDFGFRATTSVREVIRKWDASGR